MIQVHPYLTFNGKTREAMDFYQNCFGGDLEMQAVKDSPISRQWPESVQEKVLHASLVTNGLVLLASDMGGDDILNKGNSISLALTCSTKEEINNYFQLLSVGGKVTHPLHTFFDGTIGALIDKFGVNWVLKC